MKVLLFRGLYEQLTFHCFVQSLDWQRSVWEHG